MGLNFDYHGFGGVPQIGDTGTLTISTSPGDDDADVTIGGDSVIQYDDPGAHTIPGDGGSSDFNFSVIGVGGSDDGGGVQVFSLTSRTLSQSTAPIGSHVTVGFTYNDGAQGLTHRVRLDDNAAHAVYAQDVPNAASETVSNSVSLATNDFTGEPLPTGSYAFFIEFGPDGVGTSFDMGSPVLTVVNALAPQGTGLNLGIGFGL